MSISNREKGRIVSDGRRPLMARSGWDPNRFQSSTLTERLTHTLQQEKVTDVLDDADHCDMCSEIRAQRGETSALCPEHMQKALGF